MDDGNEVGELVIELYPGGIEVPKSIINRDERIALTNQLIENGTEVIYEATFFADNIEIRVDALLKVKDGYEIRELKSTKWKNEIIKDKKFQKHILSKLIILCFLPVRLSKLSDLVQNVTPN